MQRRSHLAELLGRASPSSVLQELEGDRRSKRLLLSFLYHESERIRWGAVETLALWAGNRAGENLERVRRIVRHLLWCMNDESGSVCKMAPQAIGEILHAVSDLAPEYIPLLASYIHEEPFEAGTLWALWRLDAGSDSVFQERRREFVNLLEADDPGIRGHAVLLINSRGFRPDKDRLANLKTDSESFTFYDYREKTLKEQTVSETTEQAWGNNG